MEHLRRQGAGAQLREPPVEFVAPAWRGRAIHGGEVAPKAWTLCLVEPMRAAARSIICRIPGTYASGAEEAARMAVRIKTAVDGMAALSLAPLDKLEEPVSLVALRTAGGAQMHRLDLPARTLEVNGHTGFAAGFTHLSERGARASDLAVSICAVLLAKAYNTGLEPLIRPEMP